MLVVTYDWGWWGFLLPGLERVYNLGRAAESRGERLLSRARQWVFDLLCACVIAMVRPLPPTSA